MQKIRLQPILLLALVASLVGCATPMQTRQLLQDTQHDLSSELHSNLYSSQSANLLLNTVPFWPQTEYQCGPAAMTMALNAQSVKVTPVELIPQLYIPTKQGAITPEMLAVTRFYQKIPLKLNGTLTDIIRHLKAGRPVIILQNLGLDVLPKWHFAVVVGVDFAAQQWILHSGEDAFRRMDFGVFERTWARGDYWSMVVMSFDEVPQAEDLHAYGLAMVDFEQLGQVDLAKLGYAQMLKRQPNHFLAQMGLANLAYQQGDFETAKTHFERLAARYAKDPSVWNNLAYTYAQLKLPQLALNAVAQAVALSNDNAQFLQSQEEIKRLILKP